MSAGGRPPRLAELCPPHGNPLPPSRPPGRLPCRPRGGIPPHSFFLSGTFFPAICLRGARLWRDGGAWSPPGPGFPPAGAELVGAAARGRGKSPPYLTSPHLTSPHPARRRTLLHPQIFARGGGGAHDDRDPAPRFGVGGSSADRTQVAAPNLPSSLSLSPRRAPPFHPVDPTPPAPRPPTLGDPRNSDELPELRRPICGTPGTSSLRRWAEKRGPCLAPQSRNPFLGAGLPQAPPLD